MAILDSNIEIRNEDIYKRNDVVAFMEVTDGTGEIVFARMKGFTSLGTSKSVTEYTRQYVDEDFKRTTSTGFDSSMGYTSFVVICANDDLLQIRMFLQCSQHSAFVHTIHGDI